MKQITLFIVAIFLFGASSFSQSKIGKAEESLKDEEPSSSNSNSGHSISDNSSDSSNGFLVDLIGGVVIEFFAYTIYAVAIESPFEQNSKARSAFITKHPYQHSNKGNYNYTWDDDNRSFRNELSARYISENKRLKGTHLNLEMRFLKRGGLEIDYLQLWENNPYFGTDNLAIYSTLAKYHRVRSEKLDAWWGLGASYIDGAVNQFGFTYGLGAEWFFVNPLSAEINFNQTFINNETVNKFNGILNYQINQYKLIAGYENLKIGNQSFSMASIGVGLFF